MNSYFQQLYLRANNSRFKWAMALPLLAYLFGILLKLADKTRADEMNDLIKLACMFSYIGLLIIHGSEMGNGLLRKHLTNSLKRSRIWVLSTLNASIYGILYFTVNALLIKIYSFFDPFSVPYANYFFSINVFLSFIMTSFVTLFVSLWLKTLMKTVFIGHFFVPIIDQFPAQILSRIVAKEYSLISPNYLFYEITGNDLFLDNLHIRLALVLFCILFLFINYWRFRKVNFAFYD